jgi:hypothetical protein
MEPSIVSYRFSLSTCITAVLCAMTAAPAFAADLAENTTVNGRLFVDFSNADVSSDGASTAGKGTGIDVKRFYFGATHQFDSTWSVNVTTDFNYLSNDAETQVYIKKAFLQAHFADAFVARLGSADLPWIPTVEDLYGYRYVENVIIDRLKFGTSADWGVHALGVLGGGMFNYAVAVVNGGGYKNPTRSQSMDVEARVAFMPVTGLTVMLGGYDGKLGKDIEATATPALHTAKRGDALVTYINDRVRVGAEYFQAKDWLQVTTAPEDKADGYSLWASYNFTPDWGVFARGDSAKTSKDLNSDQKDEYFNIGVANHVRKNVDISLVYKHEKVDGGGFVNSVNGNLGGLKEGKYNEVGLWALAQF